MHLRSMLVSAAAALTIMVGSGTGALESAAELPARLFAPAYDTVTVANLHALALALTSYGVDAGSYDRLTLEDLSGWGWTPNDSTAVTIWVARDGFRVAAQDVRAGSTQFEFRSVAGDLSSGDLGRSATQPADPPSAATVTVVHVPRL